MYSDVFCKVYNEFGWNYYPEAFGEQLLQWLRQNHVTVKTAMDLACGTGVLCEILRENGIEAAGMDFSEGMIRIAREREPAISYEVADMITFRPDRQFDLVTCTGDALNHISDLTDVEAIFRNVRSYLTPGGHFIFDILNENEVSTSEPFEMDFSETVRVWFQMTRPAENTVNLCIRVREDGKPQFEENIRETIHAPEAICGLLRKCGFEIIKCADQLPDGAANHGTTWFVIARKP
ncbi:MAG: class I SAM-dependent methyltransferase [Oscillospiraceae bacterium]|nr:class I SAM-dependent methyltransferase [Oscillospiraceae bacterium]